MNNSLSSPLLLILAAVAVLVLAPLAGHFVWPDIGWFFAKNQPMSGHTK